MPNTAPVNGTREPHRHGRGVGTPQPLRDHDWHRRRSHWRDVRNCLAPLIIPERVKFQVAFSSLYTILIFLHITFIQFLCFLPTFSTCNPYLPHESSVVRSIRHVLIYFTLCTYSSILELQEYLTCNRSSLHRPLGNSLRRHSLSCLQ